MRLGPTESHFSQRLPPNFNLFLLGSPLPYCIPLHKAKMVTMRIAHYVIGAMVIGADPGQAAL